MIDKELADFFQNLSPDQLRDYIVAGIFEASFRVGTSPAQYALLMAMQLPRMTYEEAVEDMARDN